MPEIIVVILCLLAGLIAGVLIAFLARPRAAVPDSAAADGIAQIHGRIDAMGSWLQNAHGQLQQTVHERLDAVSARLGKSMQTSTKHTTEHLQQLHARLAVINSAQKNITDLATQVNSLQGVLANKQSRGAFGQGQLEAIIADVLPKGAYEFQYTLKNKSRPDCAIFMPESGPLIIDAKFPLEAMTAWRGATNDEERKQAVARVKADITKHISDIADKYLIPGETQDIALMFIPSESRLCRPARTLRRHRAARATRAGDDRVANSDGHGHPGHQASAQGRADARGRRPDPQRSWPHDEGRRPD